MKKHRISGSAKKGLGDTAKKLLPGGALLAVLVWAGPAWGQITEPPAVESFSLGPGQSEQPIDDTEFEDSWHKLIEDASAPVVSPSISGAPSLPPGTPVYSPPPQPSAGGQSPSSEIFTPLSSELDANAAAGSFRPPSASQSDHVTSPLTSPPAAGQPGSISLPLGQGAALPETDGANIAGAPLTPQSPFLADVPEPRLDANQGRWLRMEVGQTDSGGPDRAAKPRPTSVPTAHVSPSEQLDALMDEATPAPAQRSAAGSLQTPEGREHVRQLFSDFLPDSKSAATVGSTGGAIASPPPAAPTQSESEAVKEYEGASAILKAGGLLTLENHYGGAEILPPLTGQPAKPAAPAPPVASPAPKQPEVKSPPPAAAAKSSGSSQKSSKSKAAGSKKPPKAKAAAPSASANLIIINETGNPEVGRIYQSVLSRMGHKVVSVGEGASSGGSGQTIINYRPGYRAQAQAVSRHLPGKKVLSEAKGGQALASDVMVYIR